MSISHFIPDYPSIMTAGNSYKSAGYTPIKTLLWFIPCATPVHTLGDVHMTQVYTRGYKPVNGVHTSGDESLA